MDAPDREPGKSARPATGFQRSLIQQPFPCLRSQSFLRKYSHHTGTAHQQQRKNIHQRQSARLSAALRDVASAPIAAQATGVGYHTAFP